MYCLAVSIFCSSHNRLCDFVHHSRSICYTIWCQCSPLWGLISWDKMMPIVSSSLVKSWKQSYLHWSWYGLIVSLLTFLYHCQKKLFVCCCCFCLFWGVYRNHPWKLVHMSSKVNKSLTDWPVLIKLYTVVVYNLRMCMKENNPVRTYFKGDKRTGMVSFCDSQF